MHSFMVWIKDVGETIWYTVESEDMLSFYCEVFPYTPYFYDSARCFLLKRVAGQWVLPQDCRFQWQVAQAIGEHLEEKSV